MGFDYQKAFQRPVQIVNDAAMQALGSYKKGKMLFLGLGTGIGSALVTPGALKPMEVGQLPYQRGVTGANKERIICCPVTFLYTK